MPIAKTPAEDRAARKKKRKKRPPIISRKKKGKAVTGDIYN